MTRGFPRPDRALRRLGCHCALDGECRHNLGEYRGVKAEIVEKELCGASLLEVPEHHFAQTGYGGACAAGETQSCVVAGKHDFVDAFECLGLVFLHPGQLGGGEVAGAS